MIPQPPQRRWKRTALEGVKRIEPNPLFPKPLPSAHRGSLPWLIVAGLVTLGAGWAALFSGWFNVEYVIVEGNKVIPTSTVESAVRSLFGSRRFGLFPQGNALFFSTAAAATKVAAMLGQEQALENLTIAKTLPGAVTVVLTERTPNLTYVVGGTAFLVDRKGIITKRGDDEPTSTRTAKVLGASTERDAPFPTLYDLNTRDAAVGDPVISEQFVDGLFALDDALKASNDVLPQRYFIPIQRCFDVITPEPEEEPVQQEPVNTNEGKGASAINGTAKKKTNTNNNANRTTNGNENANSVLDEVDPIPEDRFVETDCPIGERVLQNTELRVTTVEKWDLYLRVDASITDQLVRMYRVFDEQRIDRSKLDYIDLRFGERVIYK